MNVTRIVCVGAVVLALGSNGCKKKPKPFPPAPQLISTATTEGASIGPDAGAVTPVATAATAAPAAPADTLAPSDRAAVNEAKPLVRDIEALVKRGSITNPDKPDDGDANMKCAQLDGTRPRLEALSDAEAKQLAADAKRLCGLEVPILSADKTLKQVTISPSQASRQLMCKYASKDLDKAHKEKASDRRVRDLDARFAKACR
ncbi:MAG: hypothetical protein JWP87_4208 [Labilithrix sp.]|nr:hypothetical protein [Labilithrix sp.]